MEEEKKCKRLEFCGSVFLSLFLNLFPQRLLLSYASQRPHPHTLIFSLAFAFASLSHLRLANLPFYADIYSYQVGEVRFRLALGGGLGRLLQRRVAHFSKILGSLRRERERG